MRAEAAGDFKREPVLPDHPRTPGLLRMSILGPFCLCSLKAARLGWPHTCFLSGLLNTVSTLLRPAALRKRFKTTLAYHLSYL